MVSVAFSLLLLTKKTHGQVIDSLMLYLHEPGRFLLCFIPFLIAS